MYKLITKFFGSKEFKRKNKVTPLKLCLQFFFLMLNFFWMYHTYTLIELDKEMQASNWDPWTALNLTMPNVLNMQQGFNTKEVKKSYRNLAKVYHPDKVAKTVSDPAKQKEFKAKWNDIVRAYQTLTVAEKFQNW